MTVWSQESAATSQPALRIAVWSWVAFVVVIGIVAAVLGFSSNISGTTAPQVQNVLWLVARIAFATTGGLVVVRRPRQPVGWLLLLPTMGLAFESLARIAGPADRGSVELWLTWLAQASWAPGTLPLVTFLLLVFPTGRLPTRRWRPIAYVSWVALACLTLGNAVSPTLLEGVANPVAVGPAVEQVFMLPGGLLLLVAFAGAVASVVARFRSATGVERAQLRWFRAGAGAVFVGWLCAVVLETTGRQEVGGAVFGLGLAVIPVTVAIAVLRYRLYEIDRIISRTVSYALLTALLVGVYALGVLGIGALLPGERSDLLVAGSTLAVAALFRPLRTRIQRVVDQRFNRARYDAARIVETFGARLRDEVDLETLRDEMTDLAAASFQPRTAGVWLPGEATT